MRILAATNMYPTLQCPGSGTYVEQQIEGLRRMGVQVDLLFLNRLEIGMRVYVNLRQAIQGALVKFKPDLVHVMYGGVIADAVTRIVRDRPTIVTFHGADLRGEPASGLLRRWIAGYGIAASWRAARRASSIIVVSDVLRGLLPKDLEEATIQTLPCGIDLDRFKPMDVDACRAQLGWDPKVFHILFPASAANPIKRYVLAQDAIDQLNRLGVRAELHQLKGVENSQVPVWLNASDVLILTSVDEASPTVVKEALACDLPVVSVNVGDVRERIEGIDGCYLAATDPHNLAVKLHHVYSGKRRIEGRTRAQELSIERTALKLKNLYEKCLEGSYLQEVRGKQSHGGARSLNPYSSDV